MNLDRAFRASGNSKASAVRGYCANQVIHERVNIFIEIKARQLKTAACERIESGYDHLLAIIALLFDYTNVGWRSGTGNQAWARDLQNCFWNTAGNRNSHDRQRRRRVFKRTAAVSRPN